MLPRSVEISKRNRPALARTYAHIIYLGTCLLVLSSCAGLPSKTAEKTGCSSDEVKVSGERHSHGITSWQATCRGKSYDCSDSMGGVSCSASYEQQKQENATEERAKCDDEVAKLKQELLGREFYLVSGYCSYSIAGTNKALQTIPNLSKVRVSKIEATGSECEKAITVTDGKKSDVLESWWGEREQCLTESNPVSTHKYSPAIMQAIRHHSLAKGMTKEAVALVLGTGSDPTSTSNGDLTLETLSYHLGWHLTFINGKLDTWTRL